MACVVDHRQPIGERRALVDIMSQKKTKKDSKDTVIIDIDEFDKNNELAQVEYVEEIYMLYKLREKESRFRDYRNYQPCINARLRAGLLEWIIEVHDLKGLMPETLYLAINIVDRYLSVTPNIASTQLDLLGIAALLISSKYEEETWPLTVNGGVGDYSKDQILAMEKAVLYRLNWYLSFPTPYVFAVRYAKASLPSDKEMEDMVFFFTELALIDYSVTVRNNPSRLAASAAYAARCTLKKTPLWTETLKHYTGYSEDQVKDCGQRLMSVHARAIDKFPAVYSKYLNPDRSAVSLYPPATSLLVAN